VDQRAALLDRNWSARLEQLIRRDFSQFVAGFGWALRNWIHKPGLGRVEQIFFLFLAAFQHGRVIPVVHLCGRDGSGASLFEPRIRGGLS